MGINLDADSVRSEVEEGGVDFHDLTPEQVREILALPDFDIDNAIAAAAPLAFWELYDSVRRDAIKALAAQVTPQVTPDVTPKEEAMKVTTLTVEDTAGQIVTTVHYDEQAARAALRLNYDGAGDLDDVPEDELIQTLIDEYGLVIYIEEHDVPEPEPEVTASEPEPEPVRHTFQVGAYVRSWHRCYVTGITPEEAVILDAGGDEAVALAHRMAKAGRLEAGDIEYEEAAPIWDEIAQPDIIEFEEDS
jgi:hypothetical protein